MSTRPCMKAGCDRPKLKGVHHCYWCHLARMPIADQVRAADIRREKSLARMGGVERARVPSAEWPTGHRWCAGCQWMVPDDYVSGSRCKACSSRGAHESKLRNTYGVDPAWYEQQLAWQSGRCYLCRKTPRSRRLAVDHDHACCPGPVSCGKCVRGLVCADNEWGCNRAVLGIVTDLAFAQRVVDYYQMWPSRRRANGEPPPPIGPPVAWQPAPF